MSKRAECLRNIKLIAAYDGTHYLGWQKTKMGPSIEEVLENTLSRILQHPVILQAASRTDAGVSADGQVVNFFTDSCVSPEKLKASLNRLLPKDIVILSTEEAETGFHPTLDCKGKEYRYHLCYGRIRLPHQRHYSWHYPYPNLDIEAMRKAVPFLLGNRDFSAFCNLMKSRGYRDLVRQLESIEIQVLPEECLRFDVRGNHFLYKMVRNLVGTLVHVGCGKIKYEKLAKILDSGDRNQAGMTAPSCGLFLHRVFY